MSNWALTTRLRVPTITGALALNGAFAYSTTSFSWLFADAATLSTSRNATLALATGVPSGAVVYSSPDLLPGQTLAVSGTTLNLVGDATVPTIDVASADPVIAALAGQYARIVVMDSPIATVYNRTQSKTYTQNWNLCMTECNSGDLIEISPGAVHGTVGETNNYSSNNLYASLLAITKPCTIRNIPGEARWRLYPDNTFIDSNRGGVCIYSPTAIGEVGTFVVEGFEAENYGYGAAVRMMNGAKTVSTWNGFHTSITIRNFKAGRPAITGGSTSLSTRSESGFLGEARTLVIENGHIYDCGGLNAGQDHNAYISAETMTIRGVRSVRSRGILNTSLAPTTMDGHIWKLSAVNGTIEGCLMDCYPGGDQSELVQMKAGGNWVVRGNVFRDSPSQNNSNGAIQMSREYAEDGVTPNFEWWAGRDGNSLVFERNVYIGHYPRPIIWFFPYGTYPLTGMYPAGSGAVGADRQLASLVVRDNVAMVTSTAAPFMLSGFPGTNNVMWINNDPNGGTYWAARGNTVMTYGTAEPGFTTDEKLLKLYRRSAGPVAASGTQATQRFVWPHGYTARSDAYQGLG